MAAMGSRAGPVPVQDKGTRAKGWGAVVVAALAGALPAWIAVVLATFLVTPTARGLVFWGLWGAWTLAVVWFELRRRR
jgi:hypothetical protein